MNVFLRGLAPLLAVALVLPGCAAPAPRPTPAAPAGPTALPPVGGSGSAEAEARVVPARFANLSLPVGGVIVEVLVAEGDRVEAGAPLLRLDRSRSAAAFVQAQADLQVAQARYRRLEAGAQPAEIAIAEALSSQARAQLRQVQGGVTSSDLVAARAQLDQARAALARMESGPNTDDLRQAQAGLDQAQANLQSRRDALAAAKVQAESQLTQVANLLRDAQEAYSRIYWENRDLERLPGDLPQARIDAEAAALRAVQNAEENLAQAQVALDQARQAEISGVAAAEAQVRDAQARLDRLRSGATADQIAAARAQLAAAQANLERLRGDERGGALDSAQAAVDLADANLAGLRAGAAPGDLAVAAAEVQRAEAALALAQVTLDEAELRAPFAGTIATLAARPGEYVAAGAQLLTLADLSAWQIETDDLTERDVVALRVGGPATVTFDALPDLELRGTVSHIRDLGESQQGDMTYLVTIALEGQDQRLRWNMTALARFDNAE